MYQRILVPLDGSQLAEQVLAWVEILAKGMDCRLELLRVTEPIPAEVGRILTHTSPEEIVEALQAQAEEYLESIADPLRQRGLEVTTTVIEGAPATCIATQAEQDADTMLAMTTHGLSGLQRWYMGSVTDKILQATYCPTLVVRAFDEENPPGTVRFETLIVPLDGSPLAEQSLPHAKALAEALKLKVLLVTATPSGGARVELNSELDREGDPSASAILREEVYSSEEDEEAIIYLQRIEAEFSTLGIPSVEPRLLMGPAAEAIVDLTQETPNSLTVMATHGRSGIGRWISGSVTDRVVRQSRNLVLVVRVVEPGS